MFWEMETGFPLGHLFRRELYRVHHEGASRLRGIDKNVFWAIYSFRDIVLGRFATQERFNMPTAV